MNAHSHAFQRVLRGRAAGRDFWAWRDAMLAEAERQTADVVRAGHELVYREERLAGYTAVGEFHYLGFDEAVAAAEAADAAGVEITLLYAAHGRGGLPRLRQDSATASLHDVEHLGSDSNVRIDPLEELRELDAIGRRHSLSRELLSPTDLLSIGAQNGAAALGLAAWPAIEVDLAHRSPRGVGTSDVPGALIAGCSADVLA